LAGILPRSPEHPLNVELAFGLGASKAVLATVFVGSLWLAEGVWPMFGARERRGRHYASNLMLGLLNAAVSATLLATLLLLVTEASSRAGFGLLHLLGDEFPYLQFAAAVVLIDAWQYVWHVANHKFRWLWRFHAVHHSDAELDASSGIRFHVGEIVLSGASRLAILPLLGVTMPQLALYELLVLPVVLFHHSNIRIPESVDRALRWAIVTPRMHWVHHSDWQPETDSNFSSLFSFWDRVFKTFRLRENPAAIRLGLSDFAEDEWRPLGKVLLIPFKHAFGRPPTDGSETNAPHQ
jgi:sterol desaturase/sphingolipid hydroxylase (fatty acid hydroxylase superfamily)